MSSEELEVRMLAKIEISDQTLFRQAALIDGQWMETGGFDQSIAVLNPADQSLVGSTPTLGASDVERSISAAKSAFSTWSKVPGSGQKVGVRNLV